ncbi:MAG: RodZ domain-containing protein [Rudaea sp.]
MKTQNNGEHADKIIDASETPDSHGVFEEATPQDLSAEPMDAPAVPPGEEAFETESLGQRLRAAREARGITREEAAARTRVQPGILDALERDEYDRIGHGVYLRGYLHKYLTLLNLPLVLADRVLDKHTSPPPLTTSGTISRPRYLFERYSGSALYLVLTGVIIVPAVLLAMRAGFDPNLARIAPLDSADNVSTTARSTDVDGKSTDPTAPVTDAMLKNQSTPIALEERPLAASMTPFPANAPTVAAAPIEAAAAPAGQHTLTITFAEPSWVEVTTADGQKLEFGLLTAGTTRTYHSTQTIDARLGNVSGATVEIDGKPQDLTPFRHANVAHFKLTTGETTLSRSGG